MWKGRAAARLNGLGLRSKAAGRYARARTCYLRALALVGGLGGRDRHAVSTLCHNIGGVEHARGNHRLAELWARHGIRARTSAAPADEVALAEDRTALAAILDGLERYEEAEALYRSALRTYQTEGCVPQEIAHLLGNFGAHYAKRDRRHEAVELLEESAKQKRRLYGPLHPELAVTLNNLALVLDHAGEPARATALGGEALRILEMTVGSDHPWTLHARRNLARLSASRVLSACGPTG